MSARDVIERRAEWSVDVGDVRDWVWSLPKNSVHCWVTSPPYYGLRDYGTSVWVGGDPDCDHDQRRRENDADSKSASNAGQSRDCLAGSVKCRKCGAHRIDNQIGLEGTPTEYVETMVELFRGVRRAMHPTGTLWLNLGDTYCGGGGASPDSPSSLAGSKQSSNKGSIPGRSQKAVGYKDKDLMGIPWRVAFALQDDGWYLRQWCPWVKRNPMPESADDRPSTGCETVFLLTKEPDYYFDMEAVRKKAASEPHAPGNRKLDSSRNDHERMETVWAEDGNRNMRSSDFWFESVGMMLNGEELLGFDVPTRPFKGAHFAVFPPRLVRPMILAGTSEHGVCPKCGNPWVRQVEKERVPTRPGRDTKVPLSEKNKEREEKGMQSTKSTLVSVAGNRDPERHITRVKTLGWYPSCLCMTSPDKEGLSGPYKPIPAVVGDPFTGSGTTLMVARDRGRRGVGCELNESYAKMARDRISSVTPGLW